MDTQNFPEHNPLPPKKKKSKGTFVLFIIIFVTIGLAILSLLDNKNSATTPAKQKQFSTNTFDFVLNSSKSDTVFPAEDYIARIFINGVIEEKNNSYNQQWLLNLIKDLENDSHNKGIILYIDSPGGSVYESDEAYMAFSRYQSSKKPIWTYMSHLAASGGYYIACGTQFICANRNTLTGSIGVISGQSIDITGLMDKLGIKSQTFTAGKNKNMLNYNNPVTEEQNAIMQSIADECYEQFTTIVSINRRLDKTLVQELADGRIYTAKQALDAKLIDKICTYDECVSALKAKYNFAGIPVVDFEYKKSQSILDYLMSSQTNFSSTKSAEEKVLDLISPKIQYPAYLYNFNK